MLLLSQKPSSSYLVLKFVNVTSQLLVNVTSQLRGSVRVQINRSRSSRK